MNQVSTNLDRNRPRNDGSGNMEVLTAAAESFMERGFHASSIDDVARRISSTKGRIYHYYCSKVDLFFDVHREGMRRNFAAIAPAMAQEGTGAQRLSLMLKQYALSMMENLPFETVVVQGVHMYRIIATTPAQRCVLAELMAIRNDFESLFKTVALDGVQDGSLQISDVSIAIKAALGSISWLVVWYRPRPNETHHDRLILADKLVESLMNGLSTRV
ncbi:TetR/AcrR family transcriptional regulator [Pusillimonas sp. ANT_WB101]|uniref:TetR/AcrR family transcriptional regulator n=1 Tax=Pusillimonas sp. ANT_WB101 TaxID=2597356 RepID=UPI0011EEDFAE|nr:TetR/AcrR family transcriptional regulator [Pusillimonas sp. ANT_WB101]KAA0890793.1 TetR/AcrR family transcriptional regulator [Pusillimonas sp. ANT_WB101]